MGFSTIGGAGGGSEETPSGGAGSAEHAGVEDNSSSNADQIQINDGSIILNKDNDDVDFIVESVNSAKMLMVNAANDTVGIGCDPVEAGSANPSALLVVSNRATASTPATYAPLVVENADAAAYINVISNDGGYQGLLLGDATDPDEAGLVYNSGNGRMYIRGSAQSNAAASVTVGHSTKSAILGDSVVPPSSGFEIAKAAGDAELTISAYHDTEATTPKITLRKADNTVASPALVDDNAVLGVVSFQGHDGSGYHEGAKIEARIDGTPTDGTDLPSEITFWTTADGAGTATERLAIKPDGRGVSDFTASAWLNMNGEGTIAIRDSHNISSLADNATGKHTATFSVAMGDANYCVAGANFDTNETLQSSNFVAESRTTTTVAIWNSNAQNGTYYDAEFLNFVIFGG